MGTYSQEHYEFYGTPITDPDYSFINSLNLARLVDAIWALSEEVESLKKVIEKKEKKQKM